MKCVLSYVKQIASPGLIHETRYLGLVHWDDPEGLDREGGGSGFRNGEGAHVYLWLVHVDVWQKPSQYCKVIILLK